MNGCTSAAFIAGPSVSRLRADSKPRAADGANVIRSSAVVVSFVTIVNSKERARRNGLIKLV